MPAALDLDTDNGGFAQGSPRPMNPTLVVELGYESEVAVGTSSFVGSETPARNLNTILARRGARLRPRFSLTSVQRARRGWTPVDDLERLPRGERGAYAHAGFAQVQLPNASNAQTVLEELARQNSVWRVQISPELTPAGTLRPADVVTGRSRGNRNFEPAQGYLHAPPYGIGVGSAWAHPGGLGHGVSICDIEGNWRRTHEDLPRRIQLIGGQPLPLDQWRDHGTAVLGELLARPGTTGLRGICPDAIPLVQSPFYSGEVNAARAVANASDHLKPGDVLLLEVQALGPTSRYISVLHWDDVYSAALAATERGILVVAAAGNGGVNFDDPTFADSNLQKDSGVILVGAGIPPTSSYDVDDSYQQIGQPRSPMPFSNSGAQVVLQGWGWHVATLGFGDAQGGAPSKWMTLRFAGTSSAAPMVAGAAACLQGIARQRNTEPLSPREVRGLLIATATPAGPGRHIGGQPNLDSAVSELIQEAP